MSLALWRLSIAKPNFESASQLTFLLRLIFKYPSTWRKPLAFKEMIISSTHKYLTLEDEEDID
tara:strand:- start:464 stop:652 length:189 start_codon:yes stop_codon:yes gene_type:complete